MHFYLFFWCPIRKALQLEMEATFIEILQFSDMDAERMTTFTKAEYNALLSSRLEPPIHVFLQNRELKGLLHHFSRDRRRSLCS
jgi:hypothetical protein